MGTGGTGGDYAKCSESSPERQFAHGFTQVRNISSSLESRRRREGDLKGGKSEREMKHERHGPWETDWGSQKGGGNRVVGI